MRLSVLFCFLIFASFSWAQQDVCPSQREEGHTLVQADEFYSVRAEEPIECSRVAIAIYKSYLEKLKKDEALYSQVKYRLFITKAMLFYGDRSNVDKEEIFERGKLVATNLEQNIKTLIQKSGMTESLREDLAKAYYYQGAHWLRQMEARFTPGEWYELLKNLHQFEKLMAQIEELGREDVVSYGAYRLVGHYHDLAPQIAGVRVVDKEKAEALLQSAYAKTLKKVNGYETSTHGENTLYYADILAHNGRTEEAIRILQNFVGLIDNYGGYDLNPDRFAEFQVESFRAHQRLRDLR